MAPSPAAGYARCRLHAADRRLKFGTRRSAGTGRHRVDYQRSKSSPVAGRLCDPFSICFLEYSMINRGLTTLLLATFASSALVACAPYTLPPVQGSAQSSSPTTGGKLGGAPQPELSTAQPTAAKASTSYQCQSGATISARYPDADTAVVHYQGKTYRMQLARSADGARYTGTPYEWWTRGTGPGGNASLFDHAKAGSTGRPLEICQQTPQAIGG